MLWKIRSLQRTDKRGRPKYWSEEVGWTWVEMADVYTDDGKAAMPLPQGGVWEEV